MAELRSHNRADNADMVEMANIKGKGALIVVQISETVQLVKCALRVCM